MEYKRKVNAESNSKSLLKENRHNAVNNDKQYPEQIKRIKGNTTTSRPKSPCPDIDSKENVQRKSNCKPRIGKGMILKKWYSFLSYPFLSLYYPTLCITAILPHGWIHIYCHIGNIRNSAEYDKATWGNIAPKISAIEVSSHFFGLNFFLDLSCSFLFSRCLWFSCSHS